MLLLLYKYHVVTIICILKFVCQCYVSAFITTVNLPPLSAVRAEVKVGSFPGFPASQHSPSPLNSNQPSTINCCYSHHCLSTIPYKYHYTIVSPYYRMRKTSTYVCTPKVEELFPNIYVMYIHTCRCKRSL